MKIYLYIRNTFQLKKIEGKINISVLLLYGKFNYFSESNLKGNKYSFNENENISLLLN